MSIVSWLITYYADGFKSEQNGAKEKRKILDLSGWHAVVELQRISKDIVEYDCDPSKHDNIR